MANKIEQEILDVVAAMSNEDKESSQLMHNEMIEDMDGLCKFIDDNDLKGGAFAKIKKLRDSFKDFTVDDILILEELGGMYSIVESMENTDE